MENACKRRDHMFLSIVPHHPRASISVSVSIIGDQRPCIHIKHDGVKIRLGEVLKCASWRVAARCIPASMMIRRDPTSFGVERACCEVWGGPGTR